LQVSGAAPLYPWSIRGFAPAEIDRLIPDTAAHPWRDRLPAADGATTYVRAVRPQGGLAFNSAFPQGTNDGALWTGRGLTASLSAGVEVRVGVLSMRVEPLVFWSQNRGFDLMAVAGRPDSLRFQDPYAPGAIDLPQRFGDGSFVRIDPGQSSLRVDTRPVAAGISTANQQWGTAVDQPLLLGPNAAGFPHLFLGTGRPVNLWLGRVHGRLVWGSLGQSDYSPMQGHGSRRLMTGVIGVFQPARLRGLELGVGRFYHEAWPRGGVEAADLLRPLESFFRESFESRQPGELEGPENQLATVFFRWTLPRDRFEVWGEYLREDHNYDLEDFILEPDRSSGYLLGVRKVWGNARALRTVRAEWVNTSRSHLHQGSNQVLPYHHRETRQGHTVYGQLLGSPSAYGGGGSVVALETFTPRGRWSVDWTRMRIATRRGEGPNSNVVHSLGAEAVAFRQWVDLVGRLRGSWELNRHWGDDAFNLHASFGVRLGL
ncbi:MAG TPA: capsule assembly Wzi family protein, partial [Longimicrobium sp.]|nr:capsule assembly Wzi family protein [Longimicrobium sp.]